MRQQPVWGTVAVLVGMFFISLPQSVGAQTKEWRTMHPGAHPPTVEAALSQCERSGVSPGECVDFANQLRAGACSTVSVPDKTRYRFMNGLHGTQGATQKMLGGSTPALRCRLQSGRVLDWYHESVVGAGACNNVGEPVLVSYPPSIEITSGPLLSSPKVFVMEAPGITVHLCDCPGTHDCHDDIYLPGTRAILQP